MSNMDRSIEDDAPETQQLDPRRAAPHKRGCPPSGAQLMAKVAARKIPSPKKTAAAKAAPKMVVRPRVVVTRRLPEAVETRMAELFDVELNLTDAAMSRKQLEAAVAEAHVLVATVTDDIDDKLLAKAGPQLKLIANFGAGVDHIDLHAARARGIIVTNTPGVLTEDTADMAMALMLAVPRRLSEGERLVRTGQWQGWAPTTLLGHRISGKRLGIIGMGRIGQAVAQRARAFGMSIHYHNRERLPRDVEGRFEATYWPALEAMLSRVDIVSINCPHTPETHHLLNKQRLKLLQRHAYLINTSRGEIIDEKALADALEHGTIAGAGLDVYEREPKVSPRLLDLDNVTLLPHIGSATIEGRRAMGEKVIMNIKIWSDGHVPPDKVLEGWV
jgi:glyoxylate reductase